MKLRGKLTVCFTGLVIVCALMISIPSVISQTKQLRRNVDEKAVLQVEKIYSEIDKFLTAPIVDLQVMEAYLNLGDNLSEEKIENFLKSISKEQESYTMVYYASPIAISEGGFVYNDLDWTPPADFDLSSRDWYRNARNNNNYIFSNPYIDTMSGDVVVTVSKSCYKDGVFKGVMGIDLSIATVQRSMNLTKFTENGTAFMIDGNGVYVTNPELLKIGEEKTFYKEHKFEGTENNVASNDMYTDLNFNGKYLISKKMPEICGWTFVTFGPTNELMRQVINSGIFTSLLAILGIIFAVVTGTILSKTIVGPIKGIGASLDDIASGSADLTKRIQTTLKDEVGQVAEGFNKFVEKLQGIIRQVKESKDVLSESGETLNISTANTSSAIEQIIANIENMHSQITVQSSSVDQTAGAVNEIASNIQSLENLIENQSGSVSLASSAVEQMISNINAVNTSVEKMADSFDLLQNDATTGAKKQQDVNERITLIENQSQMLQEANSAISAIAEQTNLLAMNAAIEAAHAGEAGKGFSVVADEIRKLSETSAGQSNTIGEQLLSIQKSIAEVVEASSQSSASFASVSDKIKETDQIVRQIKASMEEQNAGSKQIIEALRNMNETTSEVHQSSAEMFEGNRMILNEVKKLQDSTYNMKECMSEMSVGAKKIDETGSSLTSISNGMKKAISDIGSEISKFSV